MPSKTSIKNSLSQKNQNVCFEKKMLDRESKQQTEERFISLSGAFNARDLGGYATTRGSKVLWGKVFRSDDLHGLQSQDVDKLARIPIKTFVDFRSPSEIAAAQDITPGTVENAYALSIEAGSLLGIEKLKDASGEAKMRHLYRLLIQEFQSVYAKFFYILLERSSVPLLFHCSAGKDRTGVAAMLFLAGLGVDRQQIFDDYMLSLLPMKEKYAKKLAKHPGLTPFYTVDSSYLQAAFDVIDQQFGGVEAYLEKALKVDIQKLRMLYTD